MTDGKISPQILQTVRTAAKGNPLARDFLLELLFMEAERGGQWQWKGTYRAKIRAYTTRKDTHNENP